MRTINQALITLIIIIISVFLSIMPAEASWVINYNPVLIPGSYMWNSESVSSPFILKKDYFYNLYFQGNNEQVASIGISLFQDIGFLNIAESPLLTELDENDNHQINAEEPTVIYKDGMYYLWYCSYDKDKIDPGFGNPLYKIRLATSVDGEVWVRQPEPVLVGSNPWEMAGVTDPSVIYHDGKFRMFYGGWGSPKSFQIGYAESNDGINWIKPFDKPLNLPSLGHVNGASIAFFDNEYHLFYHTGSDRPTNIYHVKSSDLQNWQCAESSCSIIQADGTGFDSEMVTGPSFLNEKNRQLLYYGGFNGEVWTIGLAINQLSQPQPKIIIIPGLFGSWNKDAIVYRQPVGNNDWQLNPLAKDYNGIINTFDNLGLNQNQDYYVFNYDWRKGLQSIATDLNQFIVDRGLSNEEIDLVGHSLGGLVARAYLQEFQNPHVRKIITAGSPHQGVTQVYKALSAGELEEENSWWFLAESLVLQLYRQGLETNKEILQNNFPVLKDLLATYPYLYNRQNQLLNFDQYQLKNNYLTSLNSQLDGFQEQLHTLVGTKADTVFAYRLGERTWLDKLLGFYPEGRPTQVIKESGDGVVLAESATLANHKEYAFDHGETIRKKESIKAILDELGVDYQDSQIVEGSATELFPSLFLLVMSPITVQVEYNGKTYSEEQGIIFVPGYNNDSFTVRVQGVAAGDFTVLIGSLQEANTNWQTIHGQVPLENPEQFSQEYRLNVINKNLSLDKPTLAGLISRSEFADKSHWDPCQNYLQTNKPGKIKLCLLSFQNYLITKVKKADNIQTLSLMATLQNLENLYQQYFPNQNHLIKLNIASRLLELKVRFMTQQKSLKKLTQKQKFLLQQIDWRLQNPNEIRLLSVTQLLSFVK